MNLGDANKQAMLLHLHRSIEDAANHTVEMIVNRETIEVTYPPNGGLNTAEQAAVCAIEQGDVMRSALRKIIADAAASVVFDLFNVIDGTTDPEPESVAWSSIMIVDRADDEDSADFLHDEFFASYWDWKPLRSTKNPPLDNLV